MPGAEVSKRCPKCKEVDTTSFSKCRRCGTRYDWRPPKQGVDGFNFIPILILAGLAVIAVSGYAYYQINLSKRPDHLIGKTVPYKGNYIFVSTDKSNLLSLEPAEFKTLTGSKSDDGVESKSDAAALNQLAGTAGDIGVWDKYLNDPRFMVIQKGPNDPTFSVKVIGAGAPDDKYPLVRIELLNGPRPGGVWWADASHLAP